MRLHTYLHASRPIMFGRLLFFALIFQGAAALAQSRHRDGGLATFRSDAELAEYLQRLVALRPERRPTSPACAAKAVATEPVHVTTDGVVIRGHVRDLGGNTLSGVHVTIGALQMTALTNSEGIYRLAIPATAISSKQKVAITARRLGYAPQTHAFTVSSGDSVSVDLALCAQVVTLESVVTTGTGAVSDEVTNTQHEGVDEGGIVKVQGDYLVILRRGRLFTVAVGDDELRAVAAVDAFGPDIDPQQAWYDELLVSGDRVVVIGFSYLRGGTEIGVFRLDRAGGLRHDGTYHLRSNDYYSSRNYASRLVGNTLVLYAPLFLPERLASDEQPLDALPAMRKWHRGANESEFRSIASHAHVYRPARELDPEEGTALHSVTTCDLRSVDLQCEATVVIGPPGRVFYVSPTAVYVWTAGWKQATNDAATTTLYRMPRDGSRPTALGVSGAPIDQFSFLESDDAHLNVLVSPKVGGDEMWAAEETTGPAALLRVPLASFGDGSRVAPWWRYRTLPSPGGHIVHNRFVDQHLLYGAGNGWGMARSSATDLVVVNWKTGDISRVTLPHSIDRIEMMGRDAVVVGSDGTDLHFSGIALGRQPKLAQSFTLGGATQGELRSHGFFYKADSPATGVLGLPVRGPGQPSYEHLFRESAKIVYLRNADGKFHLLGDLAARHEQLTDDGCKASCVDWYGNSRPLFLRGRVLALLGYEIVEGRISQDQITEARRLSYAAVSK
jgi:hypothetical protein